MHKNAHKNTTSINSISPPPYFYIYIFSTEQLPYLYLITSISPSSTVNEAGPGFCSQKIPSRAMA